MNKIRWFQCFAVALFVGLNGLVYMTMNDLPKGKGIGLTILAMTLSFFLMRGFFLVNNRLKSKKKLDLEEIHY